MYTALLHEGRALLPELQALRRDLHQHPEVGLDLPRTQRTVLAALEGLPLDITLGRSLSSVVAVLRGEGNHSVLLRADMDALPIREQTGVPFASTNGNMHACGHDLHTAALVGAARLLCARPVPGDVIFMFQPGEEGPGGAQPMIDEGLLDDAPLAAYGLHVGPQDRGTFHHIPGPMMASSSNLFLTVRGKGGHGSRPHDAADPVAALAEIQMALQVAITRRFDANDPVVITVTNLRAGDGAINVIPDTASLSATVRVLRDANIDAVRQMVTEVATSVAAAHRCTAEVKLDVLYGTTATDPQEDQFAAGVWGEMFGEDNVRRMPHPMMASEDFGAVLARVPGTFMWFGTADPRIPESRREWNHSPLVDFDDSVLGDMSAALAAVALARLAKETSPASSSGVGGAEGLSEQKSSSA